MKEIISAAVTPFTDDDRVDLESAARLYEFNLGQGIDGFFVLGTMGEWALLTDDEKDALVECACGVIGDKAKLLVGIADTGMPNILRNMERMQGFSHSHWTVILPGGWTGPGNNPVEYMHKIADTADRPVYFYYIPGFNNVTLTPEQFRDILAHPKIGGVKNSSGSIRTRKELLLLKQSVDFELFEGEEWGIDEALAAGCDGAVAGFASLGCKLIKRIAENVDSGDLAAAGRLQFKLIDMFHSIYGPGAAWWCAGQKYALMYLGILSSYSSRAVSQQGLTESQKSTIRACVDANRDLII